MRYLENIEQKANLTKERFKLVANNLGLITEQYHPMVTKAALVAGGIGLAALMLWGSEQESKVVSAAGPPPYFTPTATFVVPPVSRVDILPGGNVIVYPPIINNIIPPYPQPYPPYPAPYSDRDKYPPSSAEAAATVAAEGTALAREVIKELADREATHTAVAKLSMTPVPLLTPKAIQVEITKPVEMDVKVRDERSFPWWATAAIAGVIGLALGAGMYRGRVIQRVYHHFHP